MKTKTIISAIFFLSISLNLFAQEDPVSVLRKMFLRMNEIKSGSYSAIYRTKPGSKKDTLSFSGDVTFVKIPVNTDSCYIKYRFHAKSRWKMIYNGKQRFLLEDSAATIFDLNKFPALGAYMNGNANGRLLFSYFFNTKKFEDETDTSFRYSFLEPVFLGKDSCYVILIAKDAEGDVKNYKKTITIRKSDLIPIKTTEDMDWDDMHQYGIVQITNLKLNDADISINYSIDSIPAYYKTKYYEETPIKIILQKGTQMPSWQLTSLTGQVMESSKLQSKLTLIDFWYKGCAPCVKAMPELQKLHEDFKDKGFIVLGFNSYDKNDDALRDFLSYRKITYPVLLDTKSTAEKFNVETYPSFFLVNKKGVIVYSATGYSEGDGGSLRKVIEEELNK